MRWAQIACLVGISLLVQLRSAAAEPTATPAPPDPALLGLLGDWDQPITRELAQRAAQQLGQERLIRQLRALTGDGTRSRYVRVRATGMLSYFPTPENRALYEQLARAADDLQVRIQAVVSLEQAFGSTDRLGVERWLRTIRIQAEPELRAAATRSLQRLEASRPQAASVEPALSPLLLRWTPAQLEVGRPR